MHLKRLLVGVQLSLALIGTSVAAAPSNAPRYSIIGLGSLGGPTSVALDINEQGQVVGGADVSSFARHGFLWENGAMKDLGTLGAQQSEAWGINNRGQIIVNATSEGNPERVFVWYRGTTSEVLAPAPISAFDINDQGQIVGIAGTTSNPRAFRFDQNGFLELGTLGGPYSKAWEINEAGQIVGGSSTGLAEHAFLWQNGVMSDLGTLGGENSEAFGINELGQITGWAQGTAAGTPYNPFVWTSDVMKAVGPPIYARGEDINRHGLVVLEGYLVDTAADVTWALTELLPNDAGWTELSPRAINDRGQIVGAGTYQGRRLAFLMNQARPRPPLSPGLALLGAIPNPARDKVSIAFDLPATGEVVLDLYDVTGRRAATSGAQVLASGSHVLSLGRSLSPGVYHAQLRFGDQMLQTRVVITR